MARNRRTQTIFVAAWVAGCVVGASAVAFYYHSVLTARGARLDDAAARAAKQPYVLWSVDTRQKVVALTFDDGPDPQYDYRILRTLRRHGARATFFLEGRNAARHPEVVKAEIAGGNEVGNHTMNHRDFQFVDNDLIKREILEADTVIKKAAGLKPMYLRPPRGHVNLETLRIANRLGYRVVMWSIGLERVKGYSPAQSADIVVANLRPGLIILAHDSSPTRWWVPRVLPRMIKKIKARGYRIVTLTELLELSGST